MYKHFNNIIINEGIFKSLLSVLIVKYNITKRYNFYEKQ